MSQPKTRPLIRPLPERVINKIAAGEVVERPSAVVKELVENAIDAGSTKIEIHIEQAGSKLIKIIDNGWGIPADQIEIAFSRHATSKISAFADLDSIMSYGFRGEALPSIASVSRTRMTSRTPESDVGTEIIYEGGVLQSKKPVSAPVGTVIEVEDLFFNTPARRKFLKAEATEARYLSRTAMALALSRSDIGFVFTMNKRSIFNVPQSNLQQRVSALLGYGKELISIQGEFGPVKIEGFVGKPDQAQSNRWGHFIFVNGRYIQSVTLSHALSAGYGELLPKGLYPIGAILLTVTPSDVDVNVHPAKTEVRLSHEREIHDAVTSCVKVSLQQNRIVPVFQAGSNRKLEQQEFSNKNSWSPASRQESIPGISGRSYLTDEQMKTLYSSPEIKHENVPPSIAHVDLNTGEIIEKTSEQANKSGVFEAPSQFTGSIKLLGRFADLYIVLQIEDDLYIVDQHTAHERVLYEETLTKIDTHKSVGQHLLLPVQVELNPEQFAIFSEAEELFNSSGYSVKHFGGRTVQIESVPLLLARKSPENTLKKIIDDLASSKGAGDELKKKMAQSIACRGAVMSGDSLNDKEAVVLIERLLRCENKYSCPHGRPTFIKIPRFDLDRQFGRA